MRTMITGLCLVLITTFIACEKDGYKADPDWRYFEVAIRNVSPDDWRDSSFIVATKNPAVIQKIEAQLALTEANRTKIVAGKLLDGNGNYNKNASHNFKW